MVNEKCKALLWLQGKQIKLKKMFFFSILTRALQWEILGWIIHNSSASLCVAPPPVPFWGSGHQLVPPITDVWSPNWDTSWTSPHATPCNWPRWDVNPKLLSLLGSHTQKHVYSASSTSSFTAFLSLDLILPDVLKTCIVLAAQKALALTYKPSGQVPRVWHAAFERKLSSNFGVCQIFAKVMALLIVLFQWVHPSVVPSKWPWWGNSPAPLVRPLSPPWSSFAFSWLWTRNGLVVLSPALFGWLGLFTGPPCAAAWRRLGPRRPRSSTSIFYGQTLLGHLLFCLWIL